VFLRIIVNDEKEAGVASSDADADDDVDVVAIEMPPGLLDDDNDDDDIALRGTNSTHISHKFICHT
jgi:hypothetical protein